MDNKIATSAEVAEAEALPRRHEVHADPAVGINLDDLPKGMQKPVANKSPAQWAYERIILYIRNFEEQLDGDQEVAIGFTGGDAGVLRIEGMGYFDPDIVTFYGSDEMGAKTQLIQHVSQLSVMLRALPIPKQSTTPSRIGFRLAAELDKG
ncbi:MAG: hypothetical protein KUG62_03560 [Rhodobacteraceae bacterium]|nr:hypothetical protein [Paracoccaceae bacterium]